MDGLGLLAPAAPEGVDLETMHLKDAPDYITAIAGGLAHGLTPPKALHGAWGKWMCDHADAIQDFGLANFYDGKDAGRAMVNYTRLTQYLALMVAEQGRVLAEVTEQNKELQAQLLQLTENT